MLLFPGSMEPQAGGSGLEGKSRKMPLTYIWKQRRPVHFCAQGVYRLGETAGPARLLLLPVVCQGFLANDHLLQQPSLTAPAHTELSFL